MTLKTKKRLHQQSVNSKHSWRVGELCTAVYDNLGEGVIYRVTKITRFTSSAIHSTHTVLGITPVFGVIVDIEGKRTRDLDTRYCTPLTLVDLGVAYMNFGMFIAQQAKGPGDDVEKGDAEDVPAGSDGDIKEQSQNLADRGLRTDPTTNIQERP